MDYPSAEAVLAPRSYLEAGASLAMPGVLELSQVAALAALVLSALWALGLLQAVALEVPELSQVVAPAAQGFVATEAQLVEAESSP